MNEAQQALHARTGELLRGAFGSLVLESPGQPAYFVRLGPIGVRVNLEAIASEEGLLEAYSWICQELPITPELGLFLARRNVELRSYRRFQSALNRIT